MLIEDHKWQQVDSSRYVEENHNFLNGIVTNIETCVFHSKPGSNYNQARDDILITANSKNSNKHSLSVLLAAVFWDLKGLLSVNFIPTCVRINVDRYNETVNKLRHVS